VLHLNQAALSRDLGISQFYFNRITQQFIADKRITAVGIPKKHRRLQVYLVADPVQWLTEQRDLAGAMAVRAFLDGPKEPVKPTVKIPDVPGGDKDDTDDSSPAAIVRTDEHRATALDMLL
jgi:hypothetical protein